MPMPLHTSSSPRALRRCALAAALSTAVCCSIDPAAAQTSLRQRILADPRVHEVASMPLAERRAFARDYGLESLLPTTEGMTRAVANCNDSGAGSLRAAVQAAASGDLIDMTALTCSTISLTTGAIVVGQTDLTLKGAGPQALTIRNAAPNSRVIRHDGSGLLLLNGMTIADGNLTTYEAVYATGGGCIFSAGTVGLGNSLAPNDAALGAVVRDCEAVAVNTGNFAQGGCVYARLGTSLASSVISGCLASSYNSGPFGGAIAVAFGPLQVKYSEIRDSNASGPLAEGGGIFGYPGTTLIEHSTIAGNTANRSGGGVHLIAVSDHSLEIANSTISGNASNGVGGLVLNAGDPQLSEILIESSTISANVSSTAGTPGGTQLEGSIELQGTIISGNFGAGLPFDVALDGGATGADNLIGTATGTLPASGLVVSNQPGLAPLAHHGGATRTHALLAASPALDSGNNAAGSQNDQRGAGFPRVVGTRADIGAFEFSDGIFADGFD